MYWSKKEKVSTRRWSHHEWSGHRHCTALWQNSAVPPALESHQMTYAIAEETIGNTPLVELSRLTRGLRLVDTIGPVSRSDAMID
jgi:hypothetical protein